MANLCSNVFSWSSRFPTGWVLSQLNELWQLFNSIIFCRRLEDDLVESNAGLLYCKTVTSHKAGGGFSFLLRATVAGACAACPSPSLPWHRLLVSVPKHRLETADAMGFASLSPRQGIICPMILGQCIPTQLCWGGGRDGAARVTGKALCKPQCDKQSLLLWHLTPRFKMCLEWQSITPASLTFVPF